MTLRSTLQLEHRPAGRAHHCPECGAASMHPESVQSVVCPNCSPFLNVTQDHRNGWLVAVCRWARGTFTVSTLDQALAWCDEHNAPPMVYEALRKHLRTNPQVPVKLIPPPDGSAPHVANVRGEVTVQATGDIKAGDMVMMANGAPVGIAVANAQAGDMVQVRLQDAATMPTPPKPPEPSPAKQFFADLAAKDRE